MKLRSIIFRILISLAAFFFSLSARAEEFEVTWSWTGINDESRIDVEPNIDVDLSDTGQDIDRAIKIGAAVIKRELAFEDPFSGITFVLYDIKNEKEIWYIEYKWAFNGDLKDLEKLTNFFRVKIDLKNRHIVYERTIESLW